MRCRLLELFRILFLLISACSSMAFQDCDSVVRRIEYDWLQIYMCGLPVVGACPHHNTTVSKGIRFLLDQSAAGLDRCTPDIPFLRIVYEILVIIFKPLTAFRKISSNDAEEVSFLDEYERSLILSNESLDNDKYEFKRLFKSLKNDVEIWNMLEYAIERESESILNCTNFVNESHISTVLRRFNYNETKNLINWDLILTKELNLTECKRSSKISFLERPIFWRNPFKLLEVSIQIELEHLNSLTMDGVLSFNAFINVSWSLKHGLWSSEFLVKLGGRPPRQLDFYPHEIWHPIMWIHQCMGDSCTISPYNSSSIILTSSGNASYEVSKKVQVPCDPDFNNFPFDFQHCHILLYSFDRYLRVRGPTTAPKLSPRGDEWILYEIQVNQSKFVRTEYPAVEYVYYFRRDPSFYLQYLIIPIITMTILGFFTIFFPATAGDRLNFSITILLGFIFLQSVITDCLPKSAGMTKIGIYLVNSLILSAFNVAMVPTMMKLYNIKRKKRPPAWLLFLAVDVVGIIVLSKFSIWGKLRIRNLSNSSNKRATLDTVEQSKGLKQMKALDPSKVSEIEKIEVEEITLTPVRHALQILNEELEVKHEYAGKGIAKEDRYKRPSNQTRTKKKNEASEGSKIHVKKLWLQIALVLDRLSCLFYLVATILNFSLFLLPLLMFSSQSVKPEDGMW